MSFSCVEQFGVQEFGEKAAETPCGSPETEKLIIERFLKVVDELALIVVVTDDPGVNVRGLGFESDKLAEVVCPAAVSAASVDDSPKEVSELWLDSAGIAWR